MPTNQLTAISHLSSTSMFWVGSKNDVTDNSISKSRPLNSNHHHCFVASEGRYNKAKHSLLRLILRPKSREIKRETPKHAKEIKETPKPNTGIPGPLLRTSLLSDSNLTPSFDQAPPSLLAYSSSILSK